MKQNFVHMSCKTPKINDSMETQKYNENDRLEILLLPTYMHKIKCGLFAGMLKE